MGRPAEGPKVRWKRGWAYVNFTWDKREYKLALGTQDSADAATKAARAYADVVSGRLRPVARRPGELLDMSQLWDEFVEWKRPSLDPETVPDIKYCGDRMVDSFQSLDRLTEANIRTYSIARLGQVTRSTLNKERCYLRQFMQWAVEQGALAYCPQFPKLPPKAKGKRSGPQRAKPVDITPVEAKRILAKLPEWSKTIDGRKWPIRDRFEFAWEMTFRPKTVGTLSVPEHWRPGLRAVDIADENDKNRFGRTVDLTVRAAAILEKHAPEVGLIFGRHCFDKALKKAAIAVLGPVRGKMFAAYDFRHGRSKAILDAGAPLRGLSYMLGHLRPTTTDRYSRPDRNAGKAAIRAVS